VGIRLHQCPVVSPALPPAWGDKCDVPGVALCLALEVVATEEWQVLARSLYYKEASEQPHQWPHPHKHLTEMDEDGRQRDGVGRKVLQLEPVILR
jgi:hypothetical protein